MCRPFAQPPCLRAYLLESRTAPATLLHSLYPNSTDPPEGDNFGICVAAAGNLVVVAARLNDTDASDTGLAYVFTRDTGVLVSALHHPNPDAVGVSGVSVAVSGNLVVVGAYSDDADAVDSGTAYVYHAITGAHLTTLKNPSPGINDHFGYAVAVADNVVVVGAPGDDGWATDAGAAYVFDATTGSLLAPLNNPAPGLGDSFGIAIAIFGNTVVVGADGDDTAVADSGSAHVFDASNGAFMTTLLDPSPAPGDRFGHAVAVTGNTAMVGAYADDHGAPDAGSVLVFEADTGLYLRKLSDPTPTAGGNFGVAVSSAEAMAVIGAHGFDAAGHPGTAFVFNPDTGSLIAALPNPTPAEFDQFGIAVAMTGTSAVVGAAYDDTQGTDQGAAYVFSIAPRVQAVHVNGGSQQRSLVTSLAVTFDQPVTLPANPALAFRLHRQGDNAEVALAAVVDPSSPGPTVRLTFAGGAVDATSLADGTYTLTALASQIAGLDGNGDGNPGDDYLLVGNPPFNSLYRLFGDNDGDGDVDATDFGAFRAAFGSISNLAFDFDGDGDVDAADFGHFRARFGSTV